MIVCIHHSFTLLFVYLSPSLDDFPLWGTPPLNNSPEEMTFGKLFERVCGLPDNTHSVQILIVSEDVDRNESSSRYSDTKVR